MSLFQYNTGIPAAPNNPSVDQPDMLTNTDSIDGLIDVDHIGFNENLGGYHDVIHQPPQVAAPGTIAGIGQTYTKTVTGDQQLFYKSGLGVETQLTSSGGVSARAAVNFSIGAGPGFLITINNSFNVTSITRSGAGLYAINFTNALPTQYYYTAISAQEAFTQLPGQIVSNFSPIAGYGPSTTSFSILIQNINSVSAIDPVFVSCIVFA
jgi:hypothetical protein